MQLRNTFKENFAPFAQTVISRPFPIDFLEYELSQRIRSFICVLKIIFAFASLLWFDLAETILARSVHATVHFAANAGLSGITKR